IAASLPPPVASGISRRSLFKAVGLGAFVAAAPLSGCSSGSSGGSTDIRFESTKPETVEYLGKLITDFNRKNPSINVTHDSTSSLIAEFVRDQPPDLDLDNYNLTSSLFVARGVLADLASLPEAQRIAPAVQNLVSQYGSYQG